MDAGTVAAVVVVLLSVGGGNLLAAFGAVAIAVVLFLAVITYRVVARLTYAFDIRWLVPWMGATLVLINGAAAWQLLVSDSGRAPAAVEASSGRSTR